MKTEGQSEEKGEQGTKDDPLHDETGIGDIEGDVAADGNGVEPDKGCGPDRSQRHQPKQEKEHHKGAVDADTEERQLGHHNRHDHRPDRNRDQPDGNLGQKVRHLRGQKTLAIGVGQLGEQNLRFLLNRLPLFGCRRSSLVPGAACFQCVQHAERKIFRQ